MVLVWVQRLKTSKTLGHTHTHVQIFQHIDVLLCLFDVDVALQQCRLFEMLLFFVLESQ